MFFDYFAVLPQQMNGIQSVCIEVYLFFCEEVATLPYLLHIFIVFLCPFQLPLEIMKVHPHWDKMLPFFGEDGADILKRCYFEYH